MELVYYYHRNANLLINFDFLEFDELVSVLKSISDNELSQFFDDLNDFLAFCFLEEIFNEVSVK